MTDETEHRLPRTVVPERYRIDLVPDLVAATFTGTCTVVVEVHAATDTVVVNAAELQVATATAVGADGAAQEATVSHDEEAQRVTLRFAEPLATGRCELRFTYSGILNDKLHGFYRSTYTGADGEVRTIATTQFEPADARRAFPCWDEPDRKAVFEVSLVVDEGLTALSNGAPLSDEPTADGRRLVRFAETMPMSTYLVAFIVGEFELSAPRHVDGIPVRIAAPPGRSQLTPFAEEVAGHALTFLSRYFDLPYPADKIDHVAIPDFAFGAMENLGCVTYRETTLLVDRLRASQLELQRVASVVAHETAHMWFGDLVTMRWWNGIWLNEAFATFMELTTTDAYRPQWDVWTAFGAGKAAAMVVDGLRSTRPVEFAVGAPAEAEAMFDLLTYQKGGSVLRMLEQYLGAEVFRTGIARYLAEHSYSNTETTDLWDAIEASSGEPVRATMDSWIYQGGHPVISVEAATGDGSTTLTFSQQRFVYDGGATDEQWVVPLSFRVTADGAEVSHRVLLDAPSTSVTVDGAFERVVLNDGGWGFYRTRYSPDLLDALTATGLSGTAPLERLGLLGDTWASVLAGSAAVDDWVGLVGVLGAEDDPDVWSAALTPLGLLEVAVTAAQVPTLQAFVRRVAGPAFARLGWEPTEGEPERVAISRARLLATLGTVGSDGEVRREAAARYAADLSGDAPLHPDLRAAVVSVVAASGGVDAWEGLRRRYHDTVAPQEKVRYLYALAQTPDPALLARTLELCLSEEVRNQDAPFLVSMVLANREGATLGWDWVETHWDEVLDRFPHNLLVRLLEGITALVEPGLVARVHRFVASAPMPVGGPRLAQLLERMDINAAFTARAGPRLDGVLAG